MSEGVSAPPHDLAAHLSIASSPKRQIKTVGLLETFQRFHEILSLRDLAAESEHRERLLGNP
jgi:hypothetical protein